MNPMTGRWWSACCGSGAAPAASRWPRIRALVVDVDGTLTDGGMYYDASGEALKKFNTRDAHGLQRLEQAGLQVAVVTAERSPAVDARMRKLGMRHYLPGRPDKRAALVELAAQWGCATADLAYVGDDLNDLPGFEVAGFACCRPMRWMRSAPGLTTWRSWLAARAPCARSASCCWPRAAERVASQVRCG